MAHALNQCHDAARLQTVEGYRGLGAGTMRFSNYTSNPSTTAGAYVPCRLQVVCTVHAATLYASCRSRRSILPPSSHLRDVHRLACS